MDWHITLEPDNSLVGFVSWDHGQHIAKLAGELSKDREFQMKAKVSPHILKTLEATHV